MRASIIVPTINARPDLLAVCTESVERTIDLDRDEILVMEGGTFAENCNAGALRAEGEFLLLLNDDCKVDQDDWLGKLLAPFDDPQVGIVGCRLIYPDGRVQHSGVYLEAADWGLNAVNRTWDADSGQVNAVTGACLAIHKPLFMELDGLDEGFRNGLEDIDLCLRAQQAGYSVWYENGVTLVHHESMSGELRWKWCSDNIQRFVEMWHVGEAGSDSANA